MAIDPETQANLNQEKQLMRDTFDDIKTKQDALKTKVENIDDARDNYLNAQVTKYVTVEYLRKHYAYTGGTDTRTKNQFAKSLSPEQKLAILADYGINTQILDGNNGIEVKLGKIYKQKSKNKARYRRDAKDYLEGYMNVLNENQERINKVKSEIDDLKAQQMEAKKVLSAITQKDDKSLSFGGRQQGEFDKATAIAEQNNIIADLEKQINAKKEELTALENMQREFKKEFDARKTEIEEFMTENYMYIDDEEETKTQEAGKEEDKKEEKGLTTTSGPRTKKQEYKSMIRDFVKLPAEKQRAILEQGGNKEILEMARHLGIFNRAEFRRQMNLRLDELHLYTRDASGNITGEINEVKFKDNLGHEQTITKDDLRNMRNSKKMTEEKIKAIREEIDRFSADFRNKTPEEIDAFEDKLKFIRTGTLLSETTWFRGIGRLFDRFRDRAAQAYDISKSVADYAELKGMRTTRRESLLDRLRANIGRKEMDDYTHTYNKPLEKDGNSR